MMYENHWLTEPEREPDANSRDFWDDLEREIKKEERGADDERDEPGTVNGGEWYETD